MAKDRKRKKNEDGIYPDFEQFPHAPEHNPKARRRGDSLENDILCAAWNELNEVGYTHMTMEGVAARAKTNKPSIYRRWPKKSELVITVLQKFLFNRHISAPDTGNLRDDLLTLLYGVIQPLQEVGVDIIHGFLADYLGKDLPSSVHNKGSVTNEEWSALMRVILENAEARGEISLKGISRRIIFLPISLLQHEFLIQHEPISDKTVIEIIDDIFLPLLHFRKST
jgi:AcrR family transcriptional regulator